MLRIRRRRRRTRVAHVGMIAVCRRFLSIDGVKRRLDRRLITHEQLFEKSQLIYDNFELLEGSVSESQLGRRQFTFDGAGLNFVRAGRYEKLSTICADFWYYARMEDSIGEMCDRAPPRVDIQKWLLDTVPTYLHVCCGSISSEERETVCLIAADISVRWS